MSIYKKFRSVDESLSGSLSSRYDQPSYMSFKLMFAQNFDSTYNDAGQLTNRTLNYDTMPHPLFGRQGNNNINDRETYSSIDYLIDSNEYTRAKMLAEFINKFNELQTNFQWYFKSIEGVSDLLKIKPDSGQRILSDVRLTINMLEGVDLRVSHLLNLYKKIAWDDTYQRWILPDMMRYFTLNIYITEFRTFHHAVPSDSVGIGSVDDMVLSVLDGVLPTWVIKCEMCEFDLESIQFNYLNTLDVSETPQEATTTFNIKVGKIYENQIYPLFKNAYLIDKNINGSGRLIEKSGFDSDGYIKNYDHTSAEDENNTSKNLYSNQVAQNSLFDSFAENEHISGMPFNQNANQTTLLDSANTSKNTWISNALKQGMALGTNYANEWIDKLKMTPIPGLGSSVSEMTSALGSKNIFTTLGMIRKAVTVAANEQIDPSEKLSESIIDNTFSAFLQGIVKSTATSDPKLLDLSYAANVALNDKGVWDTIKDFSKATDLTSQNEVNIPVKIENSDIYKEAVNISTGNDRSKATDLDGGANYIKSEMITISNKSTATNNKLVL